MFRPAAAALALALTALAAQAAPVAAEDHATMLADSVAQYALSRVLEPRRTRISVRSEPFPVKAFVRGQAWEGQAVRIVMRTPLSRGAPSRSRSHTVLLHEGQPVAFERDYEVRRLRSRDTSNDGRVQLARLGD